MLNTSHGQYSSSSPDSKRFTHNEENGTMFHWIPQLLQQSLDTCGDPLPLALQYTFQKCIGERVEMETRMDDMGEGRGKIVILCRWEKQKQKICPHL